MSQLLLTGRTNLSLRLRKQWSSLGSLFIEAGINGLVAVSLHSSSELFSELRFRYILDLTEGNVHHCTSVESQNLACSLVSFSGFSSHLRVLPHCVWFHHWPLPPTPQKKRCANVPRVGGCQHSLVTAGLTVRTGTWLVCCEGAAQSAYADGVGGLSASFQLFCWVCISKRLQ